MKRLPKCPYCNGEVVDMRGNEYEPVELQCWECGEGFYENGVSVRDETKKVE